MVRLMLASIMGAIGYLLVFCGIAERGRWALRPWDALSEATNTPASSTTSSTSSGGGGAVSKVVGVGKKILSVVPFVGDLP
jgi:hypothetical protein